MSLLCCDINQKGKEMVQNVGVGINISLVVINYNASMTIPRDEAILNTFGTPRQWKTKGEWITEILLGEIQRGVGSCDLCPPYLKSVTFNLKFNKHKLIIRALI